MSEHPKQMMLLQEAVGFHRAGNHRRASELYRKFLKLNPDNIDALHFSGMLESHLGNYEMSVRLISHAVELMRKSKRQNPNYINAINNLGNALRYSGKPEKALETYRLALKINPNEKMVINNIGNILRDLSRLPEAVSYFTKAIIIDPNYVDAHINLGNALRDQGSLNEAIASYRKAVTLNPGHAGAHSNLAVALLSAGDFKNGWKEHEWRWQANQWEQRPYRYPVWNGEPLDGRNILVYAEQGIGDEIMFSSCYADLISVASQVIIECDLRLEPIFKRSFRSAICRGVNRKEAQTAWLSDVPAIDVQIAAGNVPMHLRPTLVSFPSHQAYLKPDPERVIEWRKRFAEAGPGFRVGISWRGGSSIADKKSRSLDLPEWEEILNTPGVNFVNLQYGDCEKDISTVRERFGIQLHDWDDADPLKDMDSFAAQIAALDLVISVDNSTIHMAGSMGNEVWVLQPFSGDWRWLRENESSYWYPGIRHFWQTSPREWKPVIRAVGNELSNRLGQIS